MMGIWIIAQTITHLVQSRCWWMFSHIRGKCPSIYKKQTWTLRYINMSLCFNWQVYTGIINNKKEVSSRVVFSSIRLAKVAFKKADANRNASNKKPETPQEFLVNTGREEHTSIFEYTDRMTLVPHVLGKKMIWL